MNINFIYFFVLCGLFGIILFFINKYINQAFKYLDRNVPFKFYPELMTIVEKIKESCYLKVYRESVATHNASGYSITQEEMETLQNDYVRLVLTVLGPKIVQDLIVLHGNEDSFIYQIAQDFAERVIADEKNLMNIVNMNIQDEKEDLNDKNPIDLIQ